jgi:hypothetical protein
MIIFIISFLVDEVSDPVKWLYCGAIELLVIDSFLIIYTYSWVTELLPV